MNKYNINKVNTKLIRGQDSLNLYNVSILINKTIDKYLEIDNFCL